MINKVVGYVFLVLVLFSSLNFIFDNMNDTTKVTVKMKQTQNQNISIFYTINEYDIREQNVIQNVAASDGYQEVVFKIPQNYIYSLDMQLNSLENEVNNVDIESIQVSSLFNKEHLKKFDNTKVEVDNSTFRETIDNGYVFSKFEVTTKIKIISLSIAMIVILIFSKKINRVFNSKFSVGNRLKVIVFASLIGMFPILLLITMDDPYSFLKQGALAQKPNLTSYEQITDKSYMGEFEDYLQEQFPYRDFFTEDYYAYNRLLQRKQFGATYINNENNILLPLTYYEDKVTTNANNLVQLNSFFVEKNIPFYSFIAPSKEELYGDNFPSYMVDESQQITDSFRDILTDNNIKNYDLKDFIYEEIYSKGELTHFKTDHHWTIETAFKSYQYILNQFDEENISFEEFDENNFDSKMFEDSFIGSDGRAMAYGNRYAQYIDDFNLIYPSGDTDYTLYDLDGTEVRSGNFLQVSDGHYLSALDPYTVRYNVYNEMQNRIITNNNIDTDSTILVIGDSYSLPISNFLSTNFKNVILLDQRQLESGELLNYVNEHYEEVDVVLDLQYVSTLQDSNFFHFQ